MAEGRMLKKKISVSEQVADLKNDLHRLLFTWCIAHLDVDGRMSGSARKIRVSVCPLLDHVTNGHIEAFIEDAVLVGLLIHYEANGERFIEMPGFAKNQTLRRDRENPSSIPPVSAGVILEHSRSTPGVSPEHSRSTPGEVKLSQVNEVNEGREGKHHSEKPATEEIPASLQTPDFLSAWQEWKQYRIEKRSKLTPSSAKSQLKALSQLTPDKAIECLQASIRNGWQGLFPEKFVASVQDEYPDAILVSPTGEKAPPGMKWDRWGNKWIDIRSSELAY